VNNPITYSSSNSSVADVCGNLLLIKGVNGTSTITATQSGNTVTGRLDVSGTNYTLQYNPITFTSSNTSVATISTYGTVTLTGAIGTSTITATQPETLNYASRSVTGTLDVSGTVTVLGPLTIPAKMLGDASFNLTAPTTNNTSGAFSYTSSNTAVATVTSGGEVTIIGIGTTTITATQAPSGLYAAASVSGSLVVNFGNTNTITQLLTDGATVIPTPVSNISTTFIIYLISLSDAYQYTYPSFNINTFTVIINCLFPW
jgi:D-arabinose 1-dehydrogenase-like Zn-dependent alcohol dehydrogenase